jgi:GTP-binding protein EngB required for normal cell division
MDDLAELQVALDSVALNELNNPEASALLDTIDGLRELQVGEIVNLPQIIVVGDQSSGKSSVLEAISRVRFPTKGDVCTRFATELVLRRAAKTKITVKIDSAGSKSAQQFHKTSFNKDVLPEIISEATEKMGIRPGAKKGFSQDILRVEISAPDVYPVTLVDLPGFFHSITAEQTEEDKKIVWQLTEKYMEQQNSIILTVVSANNNLANQTVVDEAKKYDPNRERTLGVITKPDLAAAGSEDEKKCLQLVRGQESTQNLRLGWHVLRNRSEGKEVASADERDLEEEQFFQKGAWSNIASTSRGIATLRKKLSKVLLGHIQKTLPGLIVEIESHLSSRQQALEQLGRPRSDPDDLRTYLIEIAQRYQRLARDSLNGHYADEFFGDLYEGENHKLRALLRKLNRAFYATLVTKGMDRQIEWDDDRLPLEGGFGWIKNGDSPPEYLSPFLDLFQEFPEPISISESELCKELEDLGASNQGTEFPGLPNGQLGFQLFKMQAKPWGDIAEFYIDRVTDFAKVFVEELFIHVIGTDKQTANTILINYVDEFFAEKRKALKDKLEEILRPYKSAYGPPLDSEFHANLSSKMTSRDVERIASFLVERFPAAFTDKTGKGLTRESIEVALEAAETVRVSEFGTERVIEMAMTHYQVVHRCVVVSYSPANSNFTDVVTNICREHNQLGG